MIVCSCTGTTDRTIRTLAQDQGCSLTEIVQACNAGAGCGGCRSTLEELVTATSANDRLENDPRHAGLATAL